MCLDAGEMNLEARCSWKLTKYYKQADMISSELDWRTLNDDERDALAAHLRSEGEGQRLIDIVNDSKKRLSIAAINNAFQLRSILFHDFRNDRPSFPYLEEMFPEGQNRSIGSVYDRMMSHQIRFSGDWLDDCQAIYNDFDKSRLRLFVAPAQELAEQVEYVITDGAHRAIVALRLFEECVEDIFPFPVYSTEIESG
jgi:hypothetical protein